MNKRMELCVEGLAIIIFVSIIVCFLWLLSVVLPLINFMGIGIFCIMISISIAILNYSPSSTIASNNTIATVTETNLNSRYKCSTVQISPKGDKIHFDNNMNGTRGLQFLSEEEKKDPKTSSLRGVYFYFVHVWYGSRKNDAKIASIHATNYYRNIDKTQQQQQQQQEATLSLTSDNVVLNRMAGYAKFKGKIVDGVEHCLSQWKSQERNYNIENSIQEEVNNNPKYIKRKLPKVLYVEVDEYESGHRILRKQKCQSNVQTSVF